MPAAKIYQLSNRLNGKEFYRLKSYNYFMQTILITGVDKGIGKALMEKFLAEGFFVIGIFLMNRPEEMENLETFQMDLSSSESIKNCVEETKKFLVESEKKIDILINNAGVMLDRNETILNSEKLRKSLEINLIGPADFTERMIDSMRSDENGSHIINISSIAGSFAHVDSGTGRAPNFYPTYRISKAALNMYTNTLAERLRDQNVIVSSVHPGLTKTDMGGPEANQLPAETALNIFKFAISKPETGNFWFNGEKLTW